MKYRLIKGGAAGTSQTLSDNEIKEWTTYEEEVEILLLKQNDISINPYNNMYFGYFEDYNYIRPIDGIIQYCNKEFNKDKDNYDYYDLVYPLDKDKYKKYKKYIKAKCTYIIKFANPKPSPTSSSPPPPPTSSSLLLPPPSSPPSRVRLYIYQPKILVKLVWDILQKLWLDLKIIVSNFTYNDLQHLKLNHIEKSDNSYDEHLGKYKRFPIKIINILIELNKTNNFIPNYSTNWKSIPLLPLFGENIKPYEKDIEFELITF